MSKSTHYLLPLLLVFLSCQPTSTLPPDTMPAEPLRISWRVLTHLDALESFSSQLTLTNAGDEVLEPTGWALFFNFIRAIDPQSVPDAVRITRFNGDFYRLEPTDQFPSLAAGESIDIPFEASAWAIKKSDGPSGFYLVMDDDSIIPITDVAIGPFNSPEQTSRNASDVLPVPTPASRYDRNASLSLLPEGEFSPVTPSPISFEPDEGEATIDASTVIHYGEGLANEAGYLAEALTEVLTSTPSIRESGETGPDAITLQLGEVAQLDGRDAQYDEGYLLEISPETGITITGTSAHGVFYGIQTLRALVSPAAYSTPAIEVTLPAATIFDAPRFAYRGLHLDVARNFQTEETIERVLELMAFYKLNRLHFHLTDDEGWRLEIPGLPELTEVGGRRGHTLDESDRLYPTLGSGPYVDVHPGNGHYSREEFIELLQFADRRHIQVIPEIDVPGHARAAIVAMKARHARLTREGADNPGEYLLSDAEDTSEYLSVQMFNDNVIDVCRPSTYAFLEKVVQELVSMYREAGIPLSLVHSGGDEVPTGAWTASPSCDALGEDDLHTYFLTQLDDIFKKYDLRMGGWEEISLKKETRNGVTTRRPHPDFASRSFVPYVWDNVWGWGAEDLGYQLANAGYDVIFSNATNLYFDLAYDKDPEEPGYYWAGMVDTYQAFSFIPMDLFKNASIGLMGESLNRHTVYGASVRLSARGRQHVLGIQGQLWGENARSQEKMEYLLFPKLLGLAERAWSPRPAWASVEQDDERNRQLSVAWNEFANRLGQRELPRLDGFLGGVAYRVPPPGVKVEDGMVHTNVIFPGLAIRYSDSDTLTSTSPIYRTPLSQTLELAFGTFATNNRSSRPIRGSN